MPSWKKVITSGSDAALQSLTVSTTITANSFKTPTGSSTQALTANGDVFDLTTKLDKGTYTGTAQDLKNSIDNIQIGGRNLITSDSISTYNATIDKTRYAREGIITITKETNYGGISIPARLLKPSKVYVISYKYKKINGTLVSFGGHTDPSWSDNKTYVDGVYKGAHNSSTSGFVVDDTNIHEVICYITTPSAITESHLFYIQPNRGYKGLVTVEVYDLKLEEGNKSTDWTPAPEDKQDNLQTIVGNVGVGTTSPSEKLDVNGYVKATGFKTPTGTANQALTANGGVFDLTTKADLVDGKVPSSQLPAYVMELSQNIASGGVQLLREYDIAFNFKYWGGTGTAGNVDLNNIKVIEAFAMGGLVDATAFDYVDENGKKLEIIY